MNQVRKIPREINYKSSDRKKNRQANKQKNQKTKRESVWEERKCLKPFLLNPHPQGLSSPEHFSFLSQQRSLLKFINNINNETNQFQIIKHL